MDLTKYFAVTVLGAGLLTSGIAHGPVPTADVASATTAASIVTDDFTSLAGWFVYHGNGSLSAQGARLRQNVKLKDLKRTFARVYVRPVKKTTTVGGTTLNAGDYAAGGMSQRLGHQTYGRWVMDLRMKDTQAGVRAVALTWPEERWPEAGEIDFVENGADLPPSSGRTAIANHYADPGGRNAQEVKLVDGDFTTWVTVEVDWRPDLLVISFDNVKVFRTTQNVPDGPMFLAVQTAVADGGQGTTWNGAPRSAGHIDIDNLSVYPY